MFALGVIEYPERRRLKIYDKVPTYPSNLRPFKMQKRLRYMRGPELVHNFLLHKQYGVIVRIFFHFHQIHKLFILFFFLFLNDKLFVNVLNIIISSNHYILFDRFFYQF